MGYNSGFKGLMRFYLFSDVHVFLFFAVLVQFCYVGCDFSTHDAHKKKTEKKKKLKQLKLHFLYAFWTTAWTFLNKFKSDVINSFFQLSV